MAVLHDYHCQPDGQCIILEITPVWPDIQGPEDEYDVRFAWDEEEVHRRYHVRDFDTGHSLMTKLARTFIHADHLVNQRWDFSFSDNDLGTDRYNPEKCIYAHHYWLRIAIWERSFKAEPLLHIHAFLEKEWPERNASSTFPECYLTELSCSVEETVRFGTQLLEECYEAARKRAELGLYAACDADVFGFAALPEFDTDQPSE